MLPWKVMTCDLRSYTIYLLFTSVSLQTYPAFVLSLYLYNDVGTATGLTLSNSSLLLSLANVSADALGLHQWKLM